MLGQHALRAQLTLSVAALGSAAYLRNRVHTLRYPQPRSSCALPSTSPHVQSPATSSARRLPRRMAPVWACLGAL
eukprot:10355104-Lingulodinium_polyedra.AAC.1